MTSSLLDNVHLYKLENRPQLFYHRLRPKVSIVFPMDNQHREILFTLLDQFCRIVLPGEEEPSMHGQLERRHPIPFAPDVPVNGFRISEEHVGECEEASCAGKDVIFFLKTTQGAYELWRRDFRQNRTYEGDSAETYSAG